MAYLENKQVVVKTYLAEWMSTESRHAFEDQIRAKWAPKLCEGILGV